MKKALIIAIACTGLLIACKKDHHSNKPASVWGINLSGANYLAIVNDGSSSNLKSGTADGETFDFQSVEFLDENMEVIDSAFTEIHVRQTLTIKNGFILLDGMFTIETKNEATYFDQILINQQTGKIYDISDMPINFEHNSTVYCDKYQNIYYSTGYEIIKINVLGNDNLQMEVYIPISQAPSNFFVDGDGNCFFNENKVKLATGGITTHEAPHINFLFINNKNYFIGHKTGYLNILQDSVGITYLNPDGDKFLAAYEFSFIKDNVVYFFDNCENSNVLGKAYDINANHIYTIETTPAIVSYSSIKKSDSFVYIINENNSIQRINTEQTGTIQGNTIVFKSTKLTVPANYEVYEYNFSESGTVSFSGFDLKTRKK